MHDHCSRAILFSAPHIFSLPIRSKYSPMKTIRIVYVLLVCFMLAIPATNRSAQAADKVLRIRGREFPGLDPQGTGITAQATYENALFRGLLRYDEKGNPAPSIAKDVPSVPNRATPPSHTSYTYTL